MAETSYVYAGTVRSAAGGRGGIFRQTAGDQRWEALTNGLPDETQVHAITVYPANPEVVFIGTTKGAFRSVDRGGRWERLVLPDPEADIWSITVDPTDCKTVYARQGKAPIYRPTRRRIPVVPNCRRAEASQRRYCGSSYLRQCGAGGRPIRADTITRQPRRGTVVLDVNFDTLTQISYKQLILVEASDVPDHPLSPRRGIQLSEEPGKSILRWPCLLPGIAVGVAPLRNLSGDAVQQCLAEGFTDRLVADLFRHCRAFTFAWVAGERRWAADLATPNPSELKYMISGSVQRGRTQGASRVNIRISDAVTTDYLWAGRYEFRAEDLAPIQTEITRQISRVLHILLLHEASRRAFVTSDAELGIDECLARAQMALKGEMRAELSAEAQQWFLVALARDPRNVDALVGLARTCQYLVSNPWWGDPRAAAAASDLGREAIATALELEPRHALAKCIQGMLYSAARQLEEAASAFRQALAMDEGLASAHGFGGYNAALLGRAWETLRSVERAMRLDRTDRKQSIFFWYGGFAELLLGRTEAAIPLLCKSLKRNPSYGGAQLCLMAALSLTGRHSEAAWMAESFRQQYSESPANAFERLWLSRSASPVYRAQIHPLFENIRALSAAS
jgi:TolB-like protein/Tfp pilus assembly protein PilF